MNGTPARQFALQGAAVILVLSMAWPYYGWGGGAGPPARPPWPMKSRRAASIMGGAPQA